MAFSGPKSFYGRKGILDLLRKRVIDFKDGYRQNAALVGFRHIGKTSIIEKFLSDVRSPDLVPIVIDAECKDVQYFCDRVAGSILYEFARLNSLSLQEHLDLLVETTHTRLPATTASIRKARKFLRQGKTLEAYREMIALPQVFSAETGLFCLFVLDEFQALEEWGLPDVFQELGKVIMTQKQCLYVFVSSSPEQARTILSEKLSLLFGNFEIVDVRALDVPACQEFVAGHLAGLNLSLNLRDFLIDFTGGHPLYLRLLCGRIRHAAVAHGQTGVFAPLLSRAVEDVLFDPWGVLSRHFDLMVQGLCCGKGGTVNAAGILMLLSAGKMKAREIAETLQMKQSHLSPRLKRLQEEGLVARMGRSFYIHDRLLRYWLLYVFRPRREAMVIDLDLRHQRFREEFARSLDEFHRQCGKAMPLRIIELLSCFDDEAFQSGGRQYKLPLFETITPEPLSRKTETDFHVIRALTADGGMWLVLLKDGEVGERDVAGAAAQIKEQSVRPQRCVLVALKDLDETARVRALQERMWIWNEDELRTLLHVYNKPYIAVP